MHDYDGTCYPVSFAGRVLKENEIDYGGVGNEFQGLIGRLERWAAVSSNRSMEIQNCGKEDYKVLGIFTVNITPRKELDWMMLAISP